MWGRVTSVLPVTSVLSGPISCTPGGGAESLCPVALALRKGSPPSVSGDLRFRTDHPALLVSSQGRLPV